MSKKNLILTGIPRSGTSFICNLLNQQDDVLALVEPIAMDELLKCNGRDDRTLYLEHYFEASRALIASQKKVLCLDLENATNTFSGDSREARKNTIRGVKEQEITKNLSDDFTFAIKHPNAFTALLDELVVDWQCFAMIRNPVSIIASWNTLDHPLRNGHAPMAENFNSQIRSRLGAISDAATRQISLLNWYFEQYLRYLSPRQIIAYESVVADAAVALQVILPRKLNCPAGKSMNNNSLYDKQLMQVSVERLLKAGGAWMEFYSEDDLRALVE